MSNLFGSETYALGEKAKEEFYRDLKKYPGWRVAIVARGGSAKMVKELDETAAMELFHIEIDNDPMEIRVYDEANNFRHRYFSPTVIWE